MKKNFKKLLTLAVVVLTIMASVMINTKGYAIGGGDKDPPLAPVIVQNGDKDPPLRIMAFEELIVPFSSGDKDPPL